MAKVGIEPQTTLILSNNLTSCTIAGVTKTYSVTSVTFQNIRFILHIKSRKPKWNPIFK
jgi:hypothetical protein